MPIEMLTNTLMHWQNWELLLSSFAVFLSPPPVVGSILAYDKANMFCNRLVNS